MTSSLPTFRVEEVLIYVDPNADWGEGHTILRVTCPRSDCRKRFMVNKRWPRTRQLGTSPCPWCSRVSVIPGGKFVGS